MKDEQGWFDEARLGMFVHWDHASQRGWEVSWPLVGGIFSLPKCQSVGVDEYHALADTFDPTRWDAPALAAAARDAGMRYVVFTARHHSGFAMFETRHSDHHVMRSPCGRDLVRETVDAFRAAGLRIGVYYSLSDWHHPDYPALREEHKPYVLGRTPPLPGDEQADRFRDYLKGQLDELMTGYGTIDLVWFDGGWERPTSWWHADEIEALLRSHNAAVLINDRLPGRGDFATPEQFVPPTPPRGRWESCITMNDSWGWNVDDDDYKSSREIVHTLCETAGRGGNLLLNVSPRGDGTLPPEQLTRLADLREWMQHHGDAIHGTEAGLEPWQFYGPSTRRGDATHLFLLMRPAESVTVRGVPIRRISRVELDGPSPAELTFRVRTSILGQLEQDPLGELVIDVPSELADELAHVITLTIAPP
jgi:alpha-L-fucosidase